MAEKVGLTNIGSSDVGRWFARDTCLLVTDKQLPSLECVEPCGSRISRLLMRSGRLHQGDHATDRLHQFIRKTVTLAEILDRVECQPCTGVGILPDEHLKWNIQRSR